MQAPRLVASDVDGTLLGPDERTVSARTVAVVTRLVARGVPFVLVTGRPPRWIPQVAAQVPAALAVCANGALLYDVAADRIVWHHALPAELLADLVPAVAAAVPGCGMAVERVGTSAFGTPPFHADAAYVHAWPDTDRVVVDRAELVAEPAVKLLVRCPGMSSDVLVAALAPAVGHAADLTFSHSGGLVELSARGITKGSGLAAVAEALAVPASDVVAFGDMPNDLELLRWAGHGVAMGNAHPALQAVADEVTASNVDDGVALVLERWF